MQKTYQERRQFLKRRFAEKRMFERLVKSKNCPYSCVRISRSVHTRFDAESVFDWFLHEGLTVFNYNEEPPGSWDVYARVKVKNAEHMRHYTWDFYFRDPTKAILFKTKFG